jgi:O-antigen ligase
MKGLIAGIPPDRRLIGGILLSLLLVAEVAYGVYVATQAQDTQLALAIAVGLVSVVVTFIEPAWGLYLFVIAMFAEGLFGVDGGPTGARMLGIVILGAWIVRSLSSGRFRIILARSNLFAMAYIVWGLVSTLWAIDLQVAFDRAQVIVQSFVLYILVINLVNSRKRMQSMLSIIMVVNLVMALLALLRFASGVTTGGRVNIMQISGYDPNDQAASFLLGAAMLMVLFSREARPVNKWLIFAALSVTVLAILVTASRGALVSLIVVTASVLLLNRRAWQVALLILLIGGTASLFLPLTFTERALSIVTASDRGAGRIDIWRVGLQIVRAHPFQGVGWGNFGKAFDQYLPMTPNVAFDIGRERGPHNIFFGALGELGIVGLVPFVVLIGLTVKSAISAMVSFERRGDSVMTTLAMSVFLSLLGILAAGMFIDLRYRKYFWLILALAETIRHLPSVLEERAQVNVQALEESI